MTFPPIFALAIFGILDFMELVFDITGIAAPVGLFLSFLSTLLYFLYVFLRYGKEKAIEKLFKYKNVSKKKVTKKVMKVFGNTVVPFVTVWAVWDDYQEEKREKTGEEEKSKESKKNKLIKAAALTAATVATGGTVGAAALGAKAVAGRAAAGAATKAAAGTATKTAAGTATKTAARSAAARGAGRAATQSATRTTATSSLGRTVREDIADRAISKTTEVITEKMSNEKEKTRETQEREINPWIKTNSKVSGRDALDKTIEEEVSGIKTGLSDPKDYEKDLPDFSRPETYETLLKEREEQKKKDEKKRKEIEETRLIQRQREKVEAEKIFDRSFIRRFGTKAYERMVRDREIREGKRKANKEKNSDKYKESL
ncbi:MAG TPA: hypothetical protein PLE26_01985 [Candidatus Paceibacterota bacterium]|nr:hypothetical protein [Candidatus Paceibacterota bacterium]HQB57220.1 hypothetical protein [Candidatus Paceibacterota bacterium]